VHPHGHALVGRIVVHVTHHNYLDAGIFFLKGLGAIVDDLCSTGTEVRTLASYPGREVSHEHRNVLAIDLTMNHKDVTGLECFLLFLVQGDCHLGTFKGERY